MWPRLSSWPASKPNACPQFLPHLCQVTATLVHASSTTHQRLAMLNRWHGLCLPVPTHTHNRLGTLWLCPAQGMARACLSTMHYHTVPHICCWSRPWLHLRTSVSVTGAHVCAHLGHSRTCVRRTTHTSSHATASQPMACKSCACTHLFA